MSNQNSPLTPEQFSQRMAQLISFCKDDAENGHIEADELLCQTLQALGYDEGIQIFLNLRKWYS